MFRMIPIFAILLVSCADSPQPDPNAQKFNESSNNATNNATNQSTNNATNQSTNNATNTPQVREDTVENRCEHYCDTLHGSCVTDVCTLSEEVAAVTAEELRFCLEKSSDGCAAQYELDPELKDKVDEMWTRDCNSRFVFQDRCYKFGFEACGCPLPRVGEPCTHDSDCYGAFFLSYCVPEGANGYPRDGFCVVNGCNGGPNPRVGDEVFSDYTGCGVKSPCSLFENVNQCFPSCVDTECREGYACVDGGGADRLFCIPI